MLTVLHQVRFLLCKVAFDLSLGRISDFSAFSDFILKNKTRKPPARTCVNSYYAACVVFSSRHASQTQKMSNKINGMPNIWLSYLECLTRDALVQYGFNHIPQFLLISTRKLSLKLRYSTPPSPQKKKPMKAGNKYKDLESRK